MPQFSIIAEVDIEVTASTESEARRAAFSLLSSVKPAKQRVRKSKSSKPGDPHVDAYLNGEPTSASITGIGLEISAASQHQQSQSRCCRPPAQITTYDPTVAWGSGPGMKPESIDVTETVPAPPAT